MPNTRAAALSGDTAVEGGAGAYTTEVGLRWDNRGRPVGAILAGAMMRAASLEAEMATVVSTTTEFLYPAESGKVEVFCEIVRRSSVLCCVNTSAVQRGRKVCQGTSWLTMASAHQIYAAEPPAALNWAEVPTADEKIGPGVMIFSGVLEQRPLRWIEDFANRPESVPYGLTWARFPSGGAARDLVTMACEVLVLGDVYPPLTMISSSPRREAAASGAQTLELSAHMGSLEDPSEQLLVETSGLCMSDTGLSGVVRVWSESMALRGQVTASYRLPRNRQ
jgi:Acyl-CoA thioesterase N-terminal domain